MDACERFWMVEKRLNATCAPATHLAFSNWQDRNALIAGSRRLLLLARIIGIGIFFEATIIACLRL
jgi:hypothetical protein